MTAHQKYYRYAEPILSGMVDNLSKRSLDTNPRFLVSELYFVRKHLRAHSDLKDGYVKLVQDGKFEVVNGAYAMHDTGTSYFDDILTIYTYGRKFSIEQLNFVPRQGWLVDSFGISTSTLRLLSEMGYEVVTANRIPVYAMRELINHNSLQFMWNIPSRPELKIMVHIITRSYVPPGPLDLDGCDGFNINGAPRYNILDESFNLDSKMEELITVLRRMCRGYPTSQNLFSYGADYSFTNFGLSYSMIDTIVIFSKCNGLTGRYQDKVEFRVGDLDDYFNAVKIKIALDTRKEKLAQTMEYLRNQLSLKISSKMLRIISTSRQWLNNSLDHLDLSITIWQ